VDYWGPQSKKKVHFDFDLTRERANDEDVEWQVTHNRKNNTMHEAAVAMACGGGKEQLADDDAPLMAAPLHGGRQQMDEQHACAGNGAQDACGCDADCGCESDKRAKSGPPRTTFTIGGAKPNPVKASHENAGA
jgi:hypothetical protein